MFGGDPQGRTKRDRSNRDLSQYGLFNISADGSMPDDLGDDGDLEAELLALASDGGAPKRPQRRKVAPAANLDSMVAESMKDIPSDEELSGDDDDPDLLNELSEIAGDEVEVQESPTTTSKGAETNLTKILEERLKMYEAAENNAKEAGETSRARRFGRGLKTVKDLIKQANAGRNINKDDIPPEVTINVQKQKDDVVQHSEVQPTENIIEETQPEPLSESATNSEKEELLKLLNTRKDEYKVAALQAKKSNDASSAINFIKIAKQFDLVINAVENDQPVDLSRMPGPPSQEVTSNTEQNEVQTQNSNEENNVEPTLEDEMATEPEPEPQLITASSVAEALQQRLEVYQQQEAKAKEQGNSSKARRMGRIIKQYEDAIKRNKVGKPIPVEDLPTPPGYAPIPVENTSSPKPTPPEKPKPSSASPSPPKQTPTTSRSPSVRGNASQTRIEKQITMLKARQKEFKEAALNAKQKGEMTQAKEFLRTAKGFDPLIDAAQGGFPVDLATLPVPPSAKSQLDEEYDVVMAEEATELDPEHLDILSRLEQQLNKQLKLALTTRDHNKTIGDVAGMNRFEQLALTVTRDLDIIRLAKRKANAQVPKFHYEKKDFSIVKSFTDLNDNDLELTIVRGINYSSSTPKEIDTFVKFEFPYPQDEPVRNKTVVIKNTNNPDYNETFVLPIQRTTKPCLRMFKRHGIKFEVFSKGGFFRGDTLLGTVSVKLQPLETQCELHESFDLLAGRKKVGGKLEIRLRVRDPMVTRQVEQLSEKWLVLDH